MDNLHISAEGIEGTVPEALAGPAAIDPDNPGFLSLLSVLEAALEDAVDMGVMVAYHNELADRLQTSRDLVERMPLPPGAEKEAAPALATTRTALADLEEVLALLGDYLGSANLYYVRQARKLLLKVVGSVNPPKPVDESAGGP